MKNKMTYKEADDLIRALVDAAYKKHGTYAGAAGMLQSQLALLLSYSDREQCIRDIRNLTKAMEN